MRGKAVGASPLRLSLHPLVGTFHSQHAVVAPGWCPDRGGEFGKGWLPHSGAGDERDLAVAMRSWALVTAEAESEAMWRGREVREARVGAAVSALVLLEAAQRRAAQRCSPCMRVAAEVIWSRMG